VVRKPGGPIWLETAFAVQSEHYQKELDKARERVKELEFQVSSTTANLNSYRNMSLQKDAVIADLKKANSDLAGAVIKQEPADKEENFYLPVGGDYTCGFCKSTNSRVGGIKAHIRDNH
jgi:hypothetical protein